MIGLVAAFLLAQQVPAQAAEGAITSRQVIEQSMLRYSKAKSVAGTIVMTQTARGKQAVVKTRFQYERPKYIFIEQDFTGKGDSTAHFHLASNGARFEYTPPSYLAGSPKMFREDMVLLDGYTLDYTDMFKAAKHSFIDRSSVLELIVARNEGLKEITSRIVTHHYAGKTTLNGESLHKVMARWREGTGVPAEDNVSMYFNDRFEIVRMELKQSIDTEIASNTERGKPAKKLDDIVDVHTVWTVNATVDAKVDYSLFTIKG